MRRPSSLSPIAFALGVTIFAPAADAQPTKINNCQTISNPGSYVLTDNLSAVTPAPTASLLLPTSSLLISPVLRSAVVAADSPE